EKIDAGRIAARSIEAGNKAKLDRIFGDAKDGRNLLGRGLGSERNPAPARRNHAHLTAYQIGRHLSKPINSAFSEAILDRHVLAFDVTGFGETATECIHEVCGRSGRLCAEIAHHRHRRLLRSCRERPRGRGAAKKRGELTPSYVGHRSLYLTLNPSLQPSL